MTGSVHSVSVCLAAYNGEDYIKEQVQSILFELSPLDILYIADDCSTDSTLTVLNEIKDSRLRIIKNKTNIGYVSNFERLANLATSDYIFFSDQDDVWVKGRIKLMIDASIESKKNVIFGRFNVMNSPSCDQINMDSASYNRAHLNNILRLFFGYKEYPYFGSALMITREAKKYLFPMPSNKLSHDIWIALLANLKQDILHLDKVVTMRRIHGGNLTKSTRNLIEKINTRIIWIVALFVYAIK